VLGVPLRIVSDVEFIEKLIKPLAEYKQTLYTQKNGKGKRAEKNGESLTNSDP